jgi:hypothetical protein
MTEMPVQTPGYDGCEWPLDPACFNEDWEALDPATKARSAALASQTLHRLTGYRVGGCPITVRPCTKGCIDAFVPYYGGGGFHPGVNTQGNWVNGCGCTHGCSCTAMCEVALPGPVGEVYEVKVGWTVVPPTDYRVDGSRLVWVGAGDCPWPACQDMTKNDGPGTFTVTYLNSYPVDQVGAYACAVLAMEFASACVGEACRLPPGVVSVVRQGVSFQITTGVFPDGFTGIREVDAYLGLWNPDGIRQAPSVWSPDQVQARVVR